MFIFPWRFSSFFLFLFSLIQIFSSSSFIMVWLSIELNFFVFLPFFIFFGYSYCKEDQSLCLYFSSQCFFSMMFLFGFFFHFYFFWYKILGLIFLFLGLMGKLGLFPFYSWVPKVCMSISLYCNFFLLSIQKLGSFFILFFFFNFFNFFIMYFFLIFSFMVSFLGGYFQSYIRSFLAYSSLGHGSWLILSFFGGYNLFFLYFLIYMIWFFLFCFFMKTFGFGFSFIFFSSLKNLIILKFFIFICLFSMSGIPPFSGFFSKWLVIWNLTDFLKFLEIFFILIVSSFSSFFYMNFSFFIFFFQNTEFIFFNLLNMKNVFYIFILNSAFPFFIFYNFC